MLRFDPLAGARVKVVVGHFGSGKTEFALNLALAARALGRAATLVDLDIVNPFFRSAEQGALLAARGVSLIAPPYALTGVDLPVLPAQVYGVFDSTDYTVFDVGGDDAGAAALGGYKPRFDICPHDVCYVVNPYRPYSKDVAQIADMLERIELRGRIKVTGLVCNANLGGETVASDVEAGWAIVADAARALSLPVLCVAGEARALDALSPAIPAPRFVMERYTVPSWLSSD